MRVKVLGSAAGGGFPQWNCGCSNCRGVREHKSSASPQTQVQLAWSVEPEAWTLLNASPDLRAQIEATPELWPREGARNSPIRDVVITGAEIDQVLGLLLLREFHSFRVHATESVRKILTVDNSMFGVLARFPGQVVWNDLRVGESATAGGARMEVLPLASAFPGFVSAARSVELNAAEASIGLIVAPESGGTFAFLPGAGSVSDELLERLADCDVLFFDGTFWSNDEPYRIPGIHRTARQMGHLPMSGDGGSIERFASVRRPRKLFIHLNNTNPVLDPDGEERKMVREAGWEVAFDGMELIL